MGDHGSLVAGLLPENNGRASTVFVQRIEAGTGAKLPNATPTVT